MRRARRIAFGFGALAVLTLLGNAEGQRRRGSTPREVSVSQASGAFAIANITTNLRGNHEYILVVSGTASFQFTGSVIHSVVRGGFANMQSSTTTDSISGTAPFVAPIQVPSGPGGRVAQWTYGVTIQSQDSESVSYSVRVVDVTGVPPEARPTS